MKSRKYNFGILNRMDIRYLDEKKAKLSNLKLDEKKNTWKISSLKTLIDKEQNLFDGGHFCEYSTFTKNSILLIF